MNLLGGTERFRRNFAKIAGANAAAQILGVVTLPILSRLYSPEHFGVLTTYSVVQSIGLSFVTGRLDWILPTARTSRVARRLFHTGLLFIAFFVTLLLAALALLGDGAATIAGLGSDPDIVWLLPAGIAAGGLQLLLQSWNVFGGDLTDVGVSKLVQALATILLSVGIGLVAAGPWGLVGAYVAGFFAAVLVLSVRSLREEPGLRRVDLRRSLTTAIHYRSHIASSVALGVVNVLATASIMLLLIYWYDQQVVGWYGLVFRVATAPIGLLTTALVQSFWTDAAVLAKSDPAELRRFYLDSVRRLSLPGILAVVVALFAPYYVPPIFGREEWTGAGQLLAAVSPYLFGMIVFSPTTHLIVYRKAHWQVGCDLVAMIFSVTTFSLVAARGGTASAAVFAGSLSLLAGYLWRFVLHLKANQQLILSHRPREAPR